MQHFLSNRSDLFPLWWANNPHLSSEKKLYLQGWIGIILLVVIIIQIIFNTIIYYDLLLTCWLRVFLNVIIIETEKVWECVYYGTIRRCWSRVLHIRQRYGFWFPGLDCINWPPTFLVRQKWTEGHYGDRN